LRARLFRVRTWFQLDNEHSAFGGHLARSGSSTIAPNLGQPIMARVVLTVGGYVLGNLLLPGIGGAIGGALGGYVGGIVDQQLFGADTPAQTVYGARMQDLRVQSSSYRSVIRQGPARLEHHLDAPQSSLA